MTMTTFNPEADPDSWAEEMADKMVDKFLCSERYEKFVIKNPPKDSMGPVISSPINPIDFRESIRSLVLLAYTKGSNPCDCENPPPTPESEGVFHVREDCPVHGDFYSEFNKARGAEIFGWTQKKT